MTRSFCAFVAAVLAAIPLAAGAGGLGLITAYLDGEGRTWHTITMRQGGEDVASAEFLKGPRLADLYVQGHPVAGFTTEDVLSVEARYLASFDLGDAPLSVDILYMPKGMAGPFWTTRGVPDRPEIEIVSLDIWGRAGRLVATFSGKLCRRAMISAASDLGDCRAITGVIDTEIAVAQNRF